MQRLAKLLPPLALVSALAMVPVATTAFAAAETDTQKELETFFSVFERYAGVLGPAIFAFVVERTGSGRSAILAVAVFFILGAAILAFVDVAAGRTAARQAERDALASP